MSSLDAYAKPPEAVRNVYKKYQKVKKEYLSEQPDFIDPSNTFAGLSLSRLRLPGDLDRIFLDFLGRFHRTGDTLAGAPSAGSHQVYEVQNMPGLHVYPSLFSPPVQQHLLGTLLLRDLNDPHHKTNIHTHYCVPYSPSPFFDATSPFPPFQPKDPTLHKPITKRQFLDRKLRWMTLGGQYDWTNKTYPEGPPPPFPPDSKELIEHLFPMKAEAAIVNLYTPGDTLSLHRDVSEECDRPLASVSIGCDAIFVVGSDEGAEGAGVRVVTIRLRSGDALLMSGPSRYAWHGVPKILDGTCPAWLEDWPFHVDEEGREHYKDWQGWMSRKRVNLNVRQMFDQEH